MLKRVFLCGEYIYGDFFMVIRPINNMSVRTLLTCNIVSFTEIQQWYQMA